MTVLEEITQFAQEMQDAKQAERTNITMFPSEVVELELWHESRYFVVIYFPRLGYYCVDEVRDDDEIGSGYRFSFPDFASARSKVISLMKEPPNGGAVKKVSLSG